MSKKVKTLVSCGIVVLLLFSSVVVFADFSLVDVYTEQNAPQDSILNGFSVFMDNDVNVSNDINGTAVVFGNYVSVNSKIDGDLLVFGNNVDFSGEVTGNVYCFGNSVILKGKVQKDVFMFGNMVTFSGDNEIDRDLMAFGNRLTLDGKIGRSARISGSDAQILGETGGNISISAENITVSDSAKIGGTLYYKSKDEIPVPSGASIDGVEYSKLEAKKHDESPSAAAIVLKFLGTAASAVLIWLFITFLAPVFGKKAIFSAGKKFPRTLLTGFLTFITIPVLSVVLMITVAGAGIGTALGFLYGVAVYLSFGVAAYAFANAIVGKLKWKQFNKNVWYVLAAALLMKLLTMIPYLGGWIMFAAILVGLGLIMCFLFKKDEYEPAPMAQNESVS